MGVLNGERKQESANHGHGTAPSPAEAIAIQKQLAGEVRIGKLLPESVIRIAGADVAFPGRGRRARAAVVVMAYPELEILESAVVEQATEFPYIPGLLSFRELPAILNALKQLSGKPDLVLCDGQGIAHPRRLGIASHLGVATGLATIGVGKSRLCGNYVEPGDRRGDSSALMDGGERIGTVLRTRDRVRPLFVSPGHRVDHSGARRWVLGTLGRFRLPEPIRAADRLAGKA